MENFLKVGFSANGYLSGINVDDYVRNPRGHDHEKRRKKITVRQLTDTVIA